MQDLLNLISVFGRLSLAAFGGGVGILAEMERLVVAHGWVTQREFVDIFALGQITPGPGMLISTVIGYRVAGFTGAFVAGVAMFLPTSLLTWVVADRWGRLKASPLVTAIRGGMAPVGIGLLATGGYILARTAIDGAVPAAIAAATVIALLRFKANPALVVIGSGLIGWLLT